MATIACSEILSIKDKKYEAKKKYNQIQIPMKKLLLFCLLSVFMSMTYIANAQSPGSGCCFWLEDINSSNPAEKYNLTLPYASNDYVYYYFKFDNSCGLDLDDKISIDWEITRNGVLIDNNLNQNLLIQI